MFSARTLTLASAVFSLFVSPSAAYDPNAKDNVAIYYGQNGEASLGGLDNFCQNSNVDIIPLAFMNLFVAQGNGYPGTNFADSCGGDVFPGPGYGGSNVAANNHLLKSCPSLVGGIKPCQNSGKKILLSLGGWYNPANPYKLTSNQDALDMAAFLWGAFGPKTASWTGPRPFDVDNTPAGVNVIDGFDFDIEGIVPGEQAYYITMISTLRGLFATDPSKNYLITGAPQCLVPDANLGDVIAQVQFDILFVQYYNTPQCSARSWVTANPNYGVSTTTENSSGFKTYFTALKAALAGHASANAKVYIGLPASTTAASSADYYLLPATEIKPLVEAYFCDPYFGGIMIWEAGFSETNKISGVTFHNTVKQLLVKDKQDITCPKPTGTSTSSTTKATSTTTTKTTTSTTSKSTTTTSSTSSTTSTTSKSSTTSSSTSTSTTSSKTSTTSKSTTSSSTSSSSSTSTTSSSTSSTTATPSATSLTKPASTTTTTSSSSSTASSSFFFGNSSSTSATASAVTFTTTTTSVYTITSCAPTVTNCPVGKVTTDIITLTSTYCPGNTTPTPSASSTQYTTSVVYTTLTYTITSCAPTVTNCPAKMGQLTTETKVLYTTICPVTAVPVPSSTYVPPQKAVSVPPQAQASSSFVVVIQTMSVVPVPPKAAAATSSSPAPAKVTASASNVIVKPSSAPFQGAASANRVGGMIVAVAVCVLGLAMM